MQINILDNIMSKLLFDYQALKTSFDLKPNDINELSKDFVKEVKEIFSLIKKYFNSNDQIEAKTQAHKLKGSASWFYCVKLMIITDRLAHSPDIITHNDIVNLEDILYQTIQEIEKFID